VAELVDALASGASVLRDVEVQVLFRAPKRKLVIWPVFFLVSKGLNRRSKTASGSLSFTCLTDESALVLRGVYRF
jgi:hypothetical protein